MFALTIKWAAFWSAPPRNRSPASGYTQGLFGFSDIPLNGIFAAVDMRTNKIVWRQRWKDSCYSGSTATAGDIVFTGRNDGRFVALDSRNGDVLWEFQTGAGVNASASVFQFDGHQKIAIVSAGNNFAGSPAGDSLWLFSLDGNLPPSDPPQALAARATAVTLTAGTPQPVRRCLLKFAPHVTARRARAVMAAVPTSRRSRRWNWWRTR